MKLSPSCMARSSNRFLPRVLGLVLATAMLLAGACVPDSSQTVDAATEGRRDFWDAMYYRQDYTYFQTLRAMWEINDVAVIGRIRTVSEGRTLGGKRGAPGTVETALVRVQVDELVRGEIANDSRAIVDVEILRPESAGIEELAESAPNEPILLLLQDVAGQPKPEQVDDSAVIRQPGKTLYTIPTPKALFIERNGDVVTPLDPQPGPYEESIAATTLPELAEEIRSF